VPALYTTEATASEGGRDGGRSRTSDGRLDVVLAIPEELGGSGGDGTNPEQLFAAGYAACFHSALKRAGRLTKQPTDGSTVTAQVNLVRGQGEARFALEVALRVRLPGLDGETARSVVDRAHTICPYSNATRGNIPVELIIEQS